MMQSGLVELPVMPGSTEEFLRMQEELAGTPEGGAAVLVMALLLYRDNPDFGAACVAASVDRSRVTTDGSLRRGDGRRIAEQFAANPGIPAAYIEGTSPGEGYALPEMPWRLEMSTNPYSGDPGGDETKLFLSCSGADSPRPVSLRKDARGLWRAYEWSSLLMGIRPAGRREG